MPILFALGGLLVQLVGPIVARVLLAIGISYVTYSGFDLAITWLLNEIKSNLSTMPAEVLSFLGWLWVDKAIGLLFSAYSSAMAVKLAGGTVLKKMVMK